jgi:hypothetical protein
MPVVKTAVAERKPGWWLLPGKGWHVNGSTKAERKAAVLERRRSRGSRRARGLP